jgi:hypothetical protein
VDVVNSTFGGRDGLGNVGANGGALSSIGVSFTVINSVISHNEAIGYGANPAEDGTPGGGSGGAIFFVSNDRSGSLIIDRSYLSNNPNLGFETVPGIFVLADDVEYVDSTIDY